MGIFAQDPLSGTPGATLETLASWTKNSSQSGSAKFTSSSSLRPDSGAPLYTNIAAPTSANYQVAADVIVTGSQDGIVGVTGRASVNANVQYLAFISGGTFTIYPDGVSASITPTLGRHRLALIMNGTSIKLRWDHLDLISITSSAIATAGLSGLYTNGSTTDGNGIQLANWISGSLDYVVAAPAITIGLLGVQSQPIVVTPVNPVTAQTTIIPTSTGAGYFTPASLTWAIGTNQSQSFTYTPLSNTSPSHLISTTCSRLYGGEQEFYFCPKARTSRAPLTVPMGYVGCRRPVGSVGLSGSNTIATTRTPHIATNDIVNPRVLYEGLSSNNSLVANDCVVTASLEYPINIFTGLSAQIYPWTFGGASSGSLSGSRGGTLLSDPIGITIPMGSLFAIRSCGAVPSVGGLLPAAAVTGYGAGQYTGQYSGYVEGTDATLSGNISPGDNTGRFGPSAVFGDVSTPTPVVVVLGDSIGYGQGAAQSDGSFISQGFFNSGIASPILQCQPGETLARVATMTSSAFGYLQYLKFATHVLIQLGVNDLVANTFSAMQANLLSIAAYCNAQGIPVYACTLGPHATSSTDNYLSTANQSPPVDGSEAVRRSYNAFLRTIPAPLAGIIEVGDTVEYNRSGIWKVNGATNSYTVGDGIHFGGYGHRAASIPVTAWVQSLSIPSQSSPRITV